MLATASKCGSLFLLNCPTCPTPEQVNVAKVSVEVWHKRYGHLNGQSLRQLSSEELVDGFTHDGLKQISFCKPCTIGKHHRTAFPVGGSTRAEKPLDLVHSDVCGKLNVKSVGGAEYFLTYIDDFSRYAWVYFLKRKDEVFSSFLGWNAMVERATGRKLKVLRSEGVFDMNSLFRRALNRMESRRGLTEHLLR